MNMLPSSRNIFIVEDNEMYSMMLDYFLSKESNYRFYSFKSGEECLENLHLKPYIVILDYGLPGLNGYETLLEIKKRNSRIHVVVLTSNDDCAIASKILKAGANDYILKEGAGEAQIIEKIETLIVQDELKKGSTLKEKLFYLIIAVTLLTLGLLWYEEI